MSFLIRILHRELANRYRRMKEELEDEELPSPILLLLHTLRGRPDVDVPSVSIP